MSKKIISMALACLVLLTTGLMLSGCGETTDYVATVKAVKPFKDSVGIDASYGTVLNKYITSCVWKARTQSKDLTYVDASGILVKPDGDKVDIVITFKVTPLEGKEDVSNISAHIIELDGEYYQDKGEVGTFIGNLFDAYEAKADSWADYLND